jgi:hypothetical protein
MRTEWPREEDTEIYNGKLLPLLLLLVSPNHAKRRAHVIFFTGGVSTSKEEVIKDIALHVFECSDVQDVVA